MENIHLKMRQGPWCDDKPGINMEMSKKHADVGDIPIKYQYVQQKFLHI